MLLHTAATIIAFQLFRLQNLHYGSLLLAEYGRPLTLFKTEDFVIYMIKLLWKRGLPSHLSDN